MNGMNGWWTQIWSLGTGANRIYCGIARTEEGFAVDLFQGDTCVDSLVFENRTAAVKAAAAFERRYARHIRTPRRGDPVAVVRPVADESPVTH
jgi:hypothetical protein